MEVKVCKVFSAKPYGPATRAPPLPSLRTEDGRSYETTGIDYAEPITYKISKKEQGKCYVNFHVRYVKSNPFKSNQVTKGRGVKGEAECFYYPMHQAKMHRVR